MATAALDWEHKESGERHFYRTISVLIVATDIVGFAFAGISRHIQYGKLPIVIHIHAAIFTAWMLIFLAQSLLIANGKVSLHRTLGWFSTGLAVAVVATGLIATVISLERRTAPPFFGLPVSLLLNTLQLLGFAGLFGAAIALRRRVEWHKRLIICAAAMMTEPAFGRLLPMPLLGPAMLWILGAAGTVFILAGMGNDLLRRGRIHPAWAVGLATHFLAIALIRPLATTSFVQSILASI